MVDDDASDDPDPQIPAAHVHTEVTIQASENGPTCLMPTPRPPAYDWSNAATATAALVAPRAPAMEPFELTTWIRAEARIGARRVTWIDGPFRLVGVTLPREVLPVGTERGVLRVQAVVEDALGQARSSAWLPALVFSSDGRGGATYIRFDDVEFPTIAGEINTDL